METVAEPGWYPCPVTPGQVRYFDGRGWTDAVLPTPTAAAAPAAAGAMPSDPLHWVLPTGRSGASIAAGYVGIFALFIWVLGPVSVGMGIWGLRKARVGGHGSGRSIFAIVAGVVAIVLGLMAVSGKLWS
ncbi:DUF2510 domain-containing protein [Pengzhenrongella sp.]|jgi:hypothetical protein|uniref:DUF2510 domain-containing protein n=1 Tax=Pengzhenrongella sp. TaxID=2888820 RepID=UPI002F93A657